MRALLTIVLLLVALVVLGPPPAAAQSEPFALVALTPVVESDCHTVARGVILDEQGRPLVGVPVAAFSVLPNGPDPVRISDAVSGSDPSVGPSGWSLYGPVDATPDPPAPTAGTPPSIPYWIVIGDPRDPAALRVEVGFRSRCEAGSKRSYRLIVQRTQQPPTRPPGTAPAPPVPPTARCRAFAEAAGGIARFRVCDDGRARFLSAFEQYGLPMLGYPISQRYVKDGFVVQAFQKAILQWHPDENRVAFVNLFDELHDSGLDDALLTYRQIPRPLPAGWDDGASGGAAIIARRQALLDARPALRAAYFGVRDPLLRYGLPTSTVVDMGSHYSIRLQRAVLQEWKEAVPWARAGQVTIANGGDEARALGHLPLVALIPDP